MGDMFDAALAHHQQGHSIIAVTANKKPYHSGWNAFFKKPQTEEELQEELSNGAHGIALILYPSCSLTVIDYDGPHAEDAWASTGINLPDTARVRTRSGGYHRYYIMPSHPPKFGRNIRIVNAKCDCKDKETGKLKPCGVDLLIKGYALIPPSPGYSEDPDWPLESAVALPQAVIDLAVKNEKKSSSERRTGDAKTGIVYRGQQRSVLISLAGSMRLRGMTLDAVRAALLADGKARFDPPISEHDVDLIMRSVEKWGDKKYHQNYTDLGNAHRFSMLHDGNVFYSQIRKKWIIWNDCFWEWDETGRILDLARETIQSIYGEAAVLDDALQRKSANEHARKSESRARIDAMLALATSFPNVRTTLDRFDAKPFLINTKNVTIDLTTGTARAFCSDDYLTKSIPIEYNPDAHCPQFEEFIAIISNDRPDLAAFILRACAYSITGDTGKQCFFICHGNTSNGKSTLMLVMKGLLGQDYWREVKTEILVESKNDNTDEYHLAELVGVRFVAASETGKRKTLKVNLIKQATSGEPINARRPHERPFQYDPVFKIWLSTNNRPNIDDNGEAFWRRLFLIPFDYTFSESERIDHYESILLQEAPGILNLLIKNFLEYRELGLEPPPCVLAKLKEYQGEQQDDLQSFLIDECDLGKDLFCSAKFLYESYKKYCEANGERWDSAKAFGMALNQKGFTTYPGNHNVRMRKGVCPKSPDPAQKNEKNDING